LPERFYVDTTLHPGMRFDIYGDGTVVMLVYGEEVARKKLRGWVSQSRIFREFASELAMYGIGIDPTMEIAKLKSEMAELRKEIRKKK